MSNLPLTTCTISGTSYSGAYIYSVFSNPISENPASTGTWYYYTLDALCYTDNNNNSIPISVSSADTVKISFTPQTLLTNLGAITDTIVTYLFLLGQGGSGGKAGEGYGSGGGGALFSNFPNNPTSSAGGAGTAGVVVIEW
jgi:hypothetical protein